MGQPGKNKEVLKDKLIRLYRRLSKETMAWCRHHRCQYRGTYHCCAPLYCQIAIKWASENWNIRLPKKRRRNIPRVGTRGMFYFPCSSKSTELPLMGTRGCLAPPHLRPICTMTTCDINASKEDAEISRLTMNIQKIERKLGWNSLKA